MCLKQKCVSISTVDAKDCGSCSGRGVSWSQHLYNIDLLYLISSSHHRHGQDKTRLSCLVRVGGVNRIGDKSRMSATEHLETVLSSQCLIIAETN